MVHGRFPLNPFILLDQPVLSLTVAVTLFNHLQGNHGHVHIVGQDLEVWPAPSLRDLILDPLILRKLEVEQVLNPGQDPDLKVLKDLGKVAMIDLDHLQVCYLLQGMNRYLTISQTKFNRI